MFYEILQVTILFFNAEHSGFKFACDSFTTSSKTLMYAGHLLAKTFRRRCRRRRRRRPPLSVLLFSFLYSPPALALARGRRGTGKKECGERGDEGSREGSRAGRR